MEMSNDQAVTSEQDRSMMAQDSWERFMILWGVTPEILVGSCVLSLMSIVATYFMTSRSKQTSRPTVMSDQGLGMSTDRSRARQRQNKNCASKVGADDLQSRPSYKKNVMDTVGRKSGKEPTMSDDVASACQQVPCKKNLYKFASEKLQKTLTDEQLSEENDTKRKQLEAIYNLMKDQRQLFGIENIRQIEEQMKLYG